MRKLLWVLLVASLSHAAQTYLVAAGAESYDDGSISSLSYAVADARSMAASFAAAGVPQPNITLLTSDATDRLQRPSKFNILRGLQRYREKAVGDDTLIFFFAGHGMEKDGVAYLLTSDSFREELAQTALPMTLVRSVLNGFQAKHVLFLIDACRNDPDKARAEADARLDDKFARDIRMKLAERPEDRITAALLLACDVGQRAWEMPDEGHGAFTYWLLRGLSGEAGGGAGGVKLSALAEYVEREVAAWAQRSRREQTPSFTNPTGGDFTLPEVPKAFQPAPMPAAPEPAPPTGPKVQVIRREGTLEVTADRPDATILIDGQKLGLARNAGDTLKTVLLVGKVTVRAEATGWSPAEETVEVKQGETTRVSLKLLPLPKLTIEVEVEGVEVSLDGQKIGLLGPATPAVIEGLPPGRHTIEASQGGVKKTLTVTLEPGKAHKEVAWAKFPPPGWPEYLRNYEPVPGIQYRVSPKDGMPQVLIPAGEFLMGSPPNEKNRQDDEGPQKRVFVSAFWMDLHEVTVGQYKKFCQATKRQMDTQYNKDDRHPVVVVSWDDASAYATWAGRELPTEAQWEKAARGGTTTAYPWGDTFDAAKANNGGGTKPVGSYAPNGFGLFDMSGNVWEWCRDWYDEGWYAKMPGQDPVNTTRSNARVCRGGSWNLNPSFLRAADRNWATPDVRNDNLGFRCAAPAL